MFGEKTVSLMGTVIKIWLQHSSPEPLLDEAVRRLRDYEQRFSANDPASDLMRINQQAGLKPVTVAADLFELIAIGKEQSLMADSLLNIAIGPLVKAWHVGFEDARQPTEAQLQECLELIDPRNLVLDVNEQTVFLAKRGMEIDLGALAKGYFADRIIAFFKEQGATAGFIDLGGNVLTFGEAPHQEDGLWRVGIQNPQLPRGNYATVLKVNNCSVVTSGIYERKLELGGETFHHIFDSQTGYPVKSDVASLTIVSEQSLAGEIWTTRLFGSEAVTIIQQLNLVPGIEGLVITTDNQLAATKGIQQYL